MAEEVLWSRCASRYPLPDREKQEQKLTSWRTYSIIEISPLFTTLSPHSATNPPCPLLPNST